MTADFADSLDTGSEVRATTAGLGQRLLQRAAAPGVILPGLAARIQRRSFTGGAGLATEIQRRWAPAAPAAWGYGPGLPYFGFSWTGAAPDAGSGASGPAVAARPVRAAVPTARTVGAAAASPAAQALSGLGSSLQRRHLGGRESGVVQRRALSLPPSPSSGKASEPAAPWPLTPGSPPRPSAGRYRPPGEGSQRGEGLVQRRAAAAPRASGSEIGRAIVRRSAGSFATGDPGLPALPLHRSAEPAAGASADTVRSPAVIELGPAIVHRAAGRGVVQRRSLTPASPAPVGVADGSQGAWSGSIRQISPIGRINPIDQLANSAGAATRFPAVGAGAALPLVQLRRLAAGNGRAETIQFRKTAGSPVQRIVASPVPLAELPLAPPAGVIQRNDGPGEALHDLAADAASQAPKALRGTNKTTAAPGTEALFGMATSAVHPAAAEKLDLEDVVERVMRRLKRSLAVESERHGGRRWP